MVSGTFVSAQENKITWNNSIGGSKMDIANDLVQDAENSIYTVGYSYSNDGNFNSNFGWEDAKIIKTSSNGFIEWERSIGGSDADVFTSIALDNNFIISAGWSASEDAGNFSTIGSEDGLVTKHDLNGNLIWTKSFGGNSSDRINKVIKLEQGGYVLAGYTYSTNLVNCNNRGMTDFWLIKLDEQGEMIWQHTYGGSDDDFAVDVIETKNGDLVIVGNSNSIDYDVAGNYGEWDAWALRTSSNGEIIWQQNFGNIGNDEVASVIELNNNNILLAGNSFSIDGNSLGKSDGWLVFLSEQGNLLNESKFGGKENDYIYSASINGSNEVLLSGQTYSQDNGIDNYSGNGDGWLLNIDYTGNLIWQDAIGGEEIDDIQTAIISNTGSILTVGSSKSKTGHVNGNSGSWDFWMTEFNGQQLSILENDVLLFPNPSSTNLNYVLDKDFTGEVSVIDVTGKIIYVESIYNLFKGQIDVSEFPKGIYILQCINESGAISKRFVKQ